MNDRFKFRVWDVQNQKYLYFDLLNKGSMSDFGYFATEEAPDYNEQIKCPDTNCWALIIEQCTGLRDKNGKLIYEGDIIEKQNQKFVIKYEFDSFVACSEEKKPVSIYGLFTFKLCFGGWPEKETENTIKVIGNIHENPELLEAS